MTIICIILSVLLAAAIIYSLLYKRQVAIICRRLSFIKTHDTNMLVTSDIMFRELNELTSQLNEVIDKARKAEIASYTAECNLKEAITNISHDIRTPLTSLDGYFQLMCESDNKEDIKRYTEIIEERIPRLKTMLEELFTYTKLQDNDYEIELSECDFNKLCFDKIMSFYNEFTSINLTPEIDLPQDKIIITANEKALNRILENIIRNAVAHGKSFLRISLEKDNGMAVFRCSNSIDDESKIDLNKLFCRFYKADKARTNTSAGLGLAIAKGLTEKTGGSISAQIDDNIFTVIISYNIETGSAPI